MHETLNHSKIYWNEDDRNDFAKSWPCCDIPNEGWVIFSSNGDLLDICDAAKDCEAGGGISAFLDDLKTKQVP